MRYTKDTTPTNPMINIKSLLGVQSPIARDEYEIIIADVLALSITELLLCGEREISAVQYDKILSLCAKRLSGIPLAYITGRREFYGREFSVDDSVLIPRPETELLVDLVLDLFQKRNHITHRFVDVGTGSGNIIISLIKEMGSGNIDQLFLGVDISHPALGVAKKNAKSHNVEDRISFVQSDLLEGSSDIFCNNNAALPLVIIANLPYVDLARKSDICRQDFASELIHEPGIALWAADSGLQLYKKLLGQLKLIKNSSPSKDIYCFFEIDPSQESLLETFLKETEGVQEISFTKDLAGLTRVCQFAI